MDYMQFCDIGHLKPCSCNDGEWKDPESETLVDD